MGCDLIKFVPQFCKQSLNTINVRSNALFFDFTAIQIKYKNKTLPEILAFLDIFVQKLQPTDLIYIAEEGVAPLQKVVKKKPDKSILINNKNHIEKFDEENFKILLREKIVSDPAWQKPKVIFSTSVTPGEAEHKIFTFIKLFNKNNKITREHNFINFIVSCDYDCAHLALANNLHNTFLVTNILQKQNDKEISSIHTNHEETEELGLFSSDSSFTFVNIEIFREFVFEYMTGSKEKVDEKTLKRVINDFELICLFKGNDYTYENKMKYSQLKMYKKFYEKKRFLSKGTTINNTALAEFLDIINIKDIYSPEDTKKQIDLINWCLKYYHKRCSDYIFCCPHPENATEGITLSQFLKKNPDYDPEFDVFIPSPLQRCAFKGFVPNFNIPSDIITFAKKQKVDNRLSNIRKIMDDVNQKVIPFLSEEEQEYNKNRSAFLINEEGECCIDTNFEYVEKERKSFISSLWSYGVEYALDDSDFNERVYSSSIKIFPNGIKSITREDAFNYIGKEILINWPNVCPAIVGKVVLGNELIEDDLTVRKIPTNYVFEQIEDDISHITGVSYVNENKIYLFVRPKICISESRNLYMYRSYYKVIPLDMVININSEDPIHANFEPYEYKGEFKSGESVFIIPEQSNGTITFINPDKTSIEVDYLKNTKFSVNQFDLKKMKYYSKSDIEKAFGISSDLCIDYCLEKSGFRKNYFGCDPSYFPSTVINTLLSVLRKEENNYLDEDDDDEKKTNRSPKKNVRKMAQKVRMVKVFDKSDIIWRGNYVRQNKRFPYKGARVAFVGASSSVPFGMLGTVVKKYETSVFARIEADEELTFGFKNESCQNRIYNAYIGDLYVLGPEK